MGTQYCIETEISLIRKAGQREYTCPNCRPAVREEMISAVARATSCGLFSKSETTVITAGISERTENNHDVQNHAWVNANPTQQDK